MAYGLPFQGMDPALLQALQGVNLNQFMQTNPRNHLSMGGTDGAWSAMGPAANMAGAYMGNGGMQAPQPRRYSPDPNKFAMAHQSMQNQNLQNQFMQQRTTAANKRPRMYGNAPRPRRKFSVRPQENPMMQGNAMAGQGPGRVASFLSSVGAGGGGNQHQQVAGNFTPGMGVGPLGTPNQLNRQQRLI